MRSNFHILCLGHFDKNMWSLQLIGYDIVVDVAVSQVSNKMGFIAVKHKCQAQKVSLFVSQQWRILAAEILNFNAENKF